MKLIRKDGDSFVFDLGKREKRLLLEVLKLYPLVPGAHHRVSRSADDSRVTENQKLLEEALAERTQENRRQLQAMLNDGQRFKETERGHQLTLSATQMEWLLQVINDIRVGSWLILGQPDDKKGKAIAVNNDNARYYAAMEFCGYFQMMLLDSIERQK